MAIKTKKNVGEHAVNGNIRSRRNIFHMRFQSRVKVSSGGAHQHQRQHQHRRRQHLVHVADAMTSDGTLPVEQIHTAGARTGSEQGGGVGLFCQDPLLPSTCPAQTRALQFWAATLESERGADKSLHGDSAICKSCCGRRVFSFPSFPFFPLLLPPSLPRPSLRAPDPSHPPLALLCTFPTTHPLLTLQLKEEKKPSTVIDVISRYLFTLCTFSPFFSLPHVSISPCLNAFN